MHKRTDQFETMAQKTYTLSSGRVVHVYPLSADESILPVKQIASALGVTMEQLQLLQHIGTSNMDDPGLVAAFQVALLSGYALFALSVDDPEYVMETPLPSNTLMLNASGWLAFAESVSSECRSRIGRMVYSDDDIKGIVEGAKTSLQRDVDQKKAS